MIRRFLWTKWTGESGLRHFSVVAYSFLVVFCSLLWSFLSSNPVNATYTTEFRDLGSSSAIDLNTFMVNGPTAYLNGCMFSNESSTSCFSSSETTLTRESESDKFVSPQYNQTNHYVAYSDVPYDFIDSASDVSGNYNVSYGYISCPLGKVYIGSSVSYSGISFTDVKYRNETGNFAKLQGLFSQTKLNPQTYSYSDYLPGYSGINYFLIESEINSTSFISLYEISANIENPNYFYFSNWNDGWNLYNYSSSGGYVNLNGLVVGCSQSAVKSLLEDIDPIAPTPTPTPTFPNSFESGDSTNNEDAWNFLNNLDPDSFQFNVGESTNVLTFLGNLVNTFTNIPQGIQYCQLYMPAFFGNKFSFGNNGDLLYVNLCDNSFVSALWSSDNWISVISNKAQYANQNWLYVGIKGLIWLFMMWLLLKLVMGFVYWVYEIIDITFDLKSAGGNLG